MLSSLPADNQKPAENGKPYLEHVNENFSQCIQLPFSDLNLSRKSDVCA